MEQLLAQEDFSEAHLVLNSLTEAQLQFVKVVYADAFLEGLCFAQTLLESGIDKENSAAEYFQEKLFAKILGDGAEEVN